MTEKIDALVIGAGVIGLACARELARCGLETVITERHASFGMETSSRNSEVVHAGIYYPRDSLKARLCVAGRSLLYDFCDRYGVAHRRCGKLVVATREAQLPGLADLAQAARDNGVDDLQALDATQARALEPALHCVAALHSPSTGIVDSHGLMLALLGDAERHGAVMAPKTEVTGIRPAGDRLQVVTAGPSPMTLSAKVVINAAGLSAQRVAERVSGFPGRLIPPLRLAKGSYFSLAGAAPFSRLVYPLPEPGGLGVHLTLDLGGQARFGPDVEWVDAIDVAVDPGRGHAFYAEVRRYWPALPDDALQPAYAGIRPKLGGPGMPARDFAIQGPADHGVRGLVNLFGIESPGLTSCLAIAAVVRDSLGLARTAEPASA